MLKKTLVWLVALTLLDFIFLGHSMTSWVFAHIIGYLLIVAVVFGLLLMVVSKAARKTGVAGIAWRIYKAKHRRG